MRRWLPLGFNGFRGRCMDINECNRRPCGNGKHCVNSPGGYSCPCSSGFQDSGDGNCGDINECNTNGGTCADGCSNYEGGYSCGCRTGAFKVGNSHCVSAQGGFQQFIPQGNQGPGYNQGWNSGPIKRPSGGTQGRPYVSKCYGCQGRGRRHGKRHHANRGKRDAEPDYGNYTTIDVNGDDPNDQIDENLPIEIVINHSSIKQGQAILDLIPARSPLKDNIKYHISAGNAKQLFRIHQVHGHGKLHFDKRKHGAIDPNTEFFLEIRGISMLDLEVIDLLSDNIETIKKDLKEPLKQLHVHIVIE